MDKEEGSHVVPTVSSPRKSGSSLSQTKGCRKVIAEPPSPAGGSGSKKRKLVHRGHADPGDPSPSFEIAANSGITNSTSPLINASFDCLTDFGDFDDSLSDISFDGCSGHIKSKTEARDSTSDALPDPISLSNGPSFDVLKYEPLKAPASNEAAPKVTLSKEQQYLLDLILSGRNVFYTGSAGCGKSTVLKEAVKCLSKRGKIVRIVAPTGRAALQVNGTSTWSFMGWTPDYHKMKSEKLVSASFRKVVRRRLRNTDVLIIDEISMVENHHLERINRSMKAVLSMNDDVSNTPAFGGVQVIVTGDFCQLPPVKPFEQCIECGMGMTTNDFGTAFDCPQNHGPFWEHDKWAFKSKAWKECNFVHVHLKEIHRQSDRVFINMLQKCRLGISLTQKETDLLLDHPCKVHNATHLFPTRKEVQKVNQENFDKLTAPPVTYKAVDGFDWNQVEHPTLGHNNDRLPDGSLAALKDHKLERWVSLKVGMLVVLQVNLDLPNGLCNGSQGIIYGMEEFDPRRFPKARSSLNGREEAAALSDPTIRLLGGDNSELKEQQIQLFAAKQTHKAWPKVHFHNNQRRTIYAECIVNTLGDNGPYSLLYRTQIPLVAGWAMSIHKSQGMTLDRVIVDLSRAFEEGQVYVALSRATSLEGLKILGDSKSLSVGRGGNEDVQAFLQEKFGLNLLTADS